MHAGARSVATPAAAAPDATTAAPVDDGTPAPNVRGELRRLFTSAIRAAFPEASAEVALVPCANPKFGDYQCMHSQILLNSGPVCILVVYACTIPEC